MWIGVVSLFPEMFQALTDYGITRRAVEKGLISLSFWNPREFAEDKHSTVDDKPYGGGPGMLMKVEPLRKAISAAKKAAREASPSEGSENSCPVILLGPQGEKLEQECLQEFSSCQQMILVAGRYEGIDERLIESEVDREISIGDYVLSGGEIPAMAMIDGVTRLLPGALGDDESSEKESFSQGLLEYPQYTRPECVGGQRVPEVLLSGNHKAIERWRIQQALGRTWQRRPDLIEKMKLSVDQRQLIEEYLQTSSDQG